MIQEEGLVVKVARFVLKCVALGLSAATAACLVIAYWDKIMDFFYNIADKVEEKKSACFDPEFEDYADCDL
jgi:hypothetical protein